MSENLGLLIRSRKVALNHLAEFREDVEGIVAAHAADRHTPKDIQKLKQLLKNARECAEQGISHRNAFIEIDKQIHMTLAQTTDNPIYIFMLNSFHDNIHRYYDQFLSMEQRELQENYQDLCELIQAVEHGDAEKAQKVAQNHVKRFNRYMQNRQQTEVPKIVWAKWVIAVVKKTFR